MGVDGRALRAWLAAVFWAAVVWYLGSDGFASGQTYGVLGPLLQWLFADWSPSEIYRFHVAIRKFAHLAQYALLAILTLRALLLGTRLRWVGSLAVTLVLVGGLALADEARQGRSSARTGSGFDVLLDMSGATLALIVMSALQLGLRRPVFERPTDATKEAGS